MGDHRFSLKVTLMGRDGEEHELDWWLNWTPTMPKRVHGALVALAQEAGLDVEWWEPEDD